MACNAYGEQRSEDEAIAYECASCMSSSSVSDEAYFHVSGGGKTHGRVGIETGCTGLHDRFRMR